MMDVAQSVAEDPYYYYFLNPVINKCINLEEEGGRVEREEEEGWTKSDAKSPVIWEINLHILIHDAQFLSR